MRTWQAVCNGKAEIGKYSGLVLLSSLVLRERLVTIALILDRWSYQYIDIKYVKRSFSDTSAVHDDTTVIACQACGAISGLN